MATTTGAQKMSPKLLVDTKAHRNRGETPRGNLYESIGNLSETHFQSDNLAKDSLMNPKFPHAATQLALLSLDGSTSFTKTYYSCQHCDKYISVYARAICPSCKRIMAYELVDAANGVAAAGEGGFVKGKGLNLLKASLNTKEVLTFLDRKHGGQ
ncbi:hypothetical protein RHSIM_Rhsim09G0163300 [Rhododendron simsii]|uniref:Uncharacterized protein n=1 Tax=Rhododendron simsii TaxID=118357 RepID=A0A834LGN6_RHOSS|nr:hypothetical protein RHSIM_Rhsim09G0163300 [Rhododendron simsii]